MSNTILVAFATANTGSSAVKELSNSGKVSVRALVRKTDTPQAQALAALPNVTLVQGSFEDESSIVKALEGVKRAMLVTGAGQHEQFDRETTFIDLATKAGVEGVVRISTATILIHPGSTGVYARAHACIQKYIEKHHSPVVDLNPNWFFDNFIGSAGEVKHAGTISIPTPGNGRLCNYIDPRDVGAAAAAILLQPSDIFAKFLAQRIVEVHGPSPTNFQGKINALSKAVGYPIRINQVPEESYVATLVSYGMNKVFARSFAHTIEMCDGSIPDDSPGTNETTELLLSIGWKPQYDVDAWANSEHVLAAFRK